MYTQNNSPYSPRNTQKVCRSDKEKVLCGVCGGLAAYWDISVFWVRVVAIVALIMWFPLSILVYYICCWIMPKSSECFQTSISKEPALNSNGSQPRMYSQKEAFQTISAQFNNLESKICYLEDKVTSKEFMLNRKFQNL